MMSDIIFESLDFSEKKILPASSKSVGFSSVSAVTEFCGNGSFQAVFHDSETEEFIINHPEGLLVKWDRFQGFITDLQFKEREKWIYGSHLNAILHKFVIPPQNVSNVNPQDILKSIFNEHISCINFIENAEKFNNTSYVTEKCMYADEFVKGLLGTVNAGYKVYIKNKNYYFETIKPRNNPLILSKNNLNVYELQEDFSSKNAAYGGWYYQTMEDDGTELENPAWIYIQKDNKNGIFKQDIILQSNSPQEAIDELNTHINNYKITCKTRNIEYLNDYLLGDVIRLQKGDRTTYKQVSSVDIWQEGMAIHEEPTLTEQEE